MNGPKQRVAQQCTRGAGGFSPWAMTQIGGEVRPAGRGAPGLARLTRWRWLTRAGLSKGAATPCTSPAIRRKAAEARIQGELAGMDGSDGEGSGSPSCALLGQSVSARVDFF